MKKLTLNVESLAVESFETARAKRAQGTVHAHLLATQGSPNTCNVQCCQTCQTCPTAVYSCFC